jgi:hypothetical protein
MAISIEFGSENKHLCVRCKGRLEIGRVHELLAMVKDEAVRSGVQFILINAVEVPPPNNTYDRYELGVKIAAIFKHLFKIAIIFPKEHTTKFAENVAVNRGAKVLVTSSETEAKDWFYGKTYTL